MHVHDFLLHKITMKFIILCCDLGTEMIYTADGTHLHSNGSAYDHKSQICANSNNSFILCVPHGILQFFVVYSLIANIQYLCFDKCVLCHHQCLEWSVGVATQQTGARECNNLNTFKTFMMTWKTSKQFCWNTDIIRWQLDYIQQKIIIAVVKECE